MATTVQTLFAAGPERRVALCYFLLMTPLGASVVGAGIWFAENGLDPRQIAVINVAPVLVMIALNLTIGRIADRASDWRQTIVTASAIQGAVTMALFFVDSFWGILAVWTLSVTPNQAIGPVLDAATMRMTRRNGTHFGALRACATVGYMLSVGASGMVIARFGIESFVPLYVGLMLVKALVAQALPFFRAPPGTPPQSSAAPSGSPKSCAPGSCCRSSATPWPSAPTSSSTPSPRSGGRSRASPRM